MSEAGSLSTLGASPFVSPSGLPLVETAQHFHQSAGSRESSRKGRTNGRRSYRIPIRCKQWWLCQPSSQGLFRVIRCRPRPGSGAGCPRPAEKYWAMAQGRERDEVHNVALGASLSVRCGVPATDSSSRKFFLRTTTSPSELQPLPTLCFLLSCRPAVPQIRPLQPPTPSCRLPFSVTSPLISYSMTTVPSLYSSLPPTTHLPPLPPPLSYPVLLRHS